jgi:lipopolysaccharide export system protein LptA
MAKIKIDGSTTQTVRTLLIASFAAVGVVLLGAFGLHKLQQHGFHLDLPGRLGVDISQTANGYTYSQSKGGHTLFTLHAAKIVQFKDDQAELRDVSITLYGPEGSKRADHITGADFLYNKATGTVTAKGAVEIDLASLAPPAQHGAPAPPDSIHVQTSDLSFDQNSGEAQTSQPLAFTLPRAHGTAVGGDYNAKTGVLVLQTAVVLNADQNGQPAVVHAEHAQLLRDAHMAYLLQATSEYEGGHDSADEAILHFRPDGSIEHLDGRDHVHMETAEGAELYSNWATADFDAHSQPMTAHAGGGVNFVSDTAASTMHGNATTGTLQFVPGPDGRASLQHAVFSNAVSFVLQQNSLGGDPRGSATRELTASYLTVDFAPGKDGKGVAQRAVAKGGAMVSLHDLPYGAPPKQTVIHGQQLVALLHDGHELKQLDGIGSTSVQETAGDGASQTTNGDRLHATFLQTPEVRGQHPAMSAAQAKSGGAAVSDSAAVEMAVQQGHVTMVAQPAFQAKQSDGSPQQPLYAEAAEGTYRAADETLTLVGDAATPPRVHNATLAVTARTIAFHRDSGNAVAQGDVRSTYVQGRPQGSLAGNAASKTAGAAGAAGAGGAGSAGHAAMANGHAAGLGGAGAVHVIAATATMSRATNVAVFDGAAGAPARMWQGANSVTAPVLELGKQQGSLEAHGTPSQTVAAVHAVFAAKAGDTGHAGGVARGLTRVAAETLFYSDTTRSGDFRGGVVAEQPDGVVHADEAQVFLSETPAGQPSTLERLVADGHVQLTQPGRRGTGEKLLYTAADGDYVLTGTASEPPRATDTQHGATTGAALVFRAGSDSVEVMSHDAEGNSRRTVTDTRTPK